MNLMSIYAAINQTAKAYPGGASGLAQDLGVQKGTFINKCNPTSEQHLLNIRDLMAVMEQTGDLQILQAIARAFDRVLTPVKPFEEYSDEALLDAWSAWDVERAETIKEIRKALYDGQMDEAQFDRIEQEMFQDFEKELALLERLKGLVVPSHRHPESPLPEVSLPG